MSESSIKARKRELEVRQATADAEKAELELAQARLQFDVMKREYDYEHAQSGESLGTFRFSTAVTDNSAAAFAAKVRKYAALNEGAPITIVLNTPGGAVIPGLGLYDELRSVAAQGHHITTQVRGYAASFGVILLQAGDLRLVGPESYLMVHELSAGTGGKLHEMADEIEFYKRINQRLFRIMADRSGGKFTASSLYRKAKATDLWLSASEAVDKYGLADSLG